MSKILLIYKEDKLTLRLPSRLFITPNEKKRIVRLIMKDLEIKGLIDAETSKKITKCPLNVVELSFFSA
jgi:hypothetical protein